MIYPDKKMVSVVRVDGIRYWKKQGINLALIAVEHQSLTDYHMVFRNMMTESLIYYRQWKKNKRRYSKEYSQWMGKKFRLNGSKEFLSGMKRTDKFIPVILLVINWSGEKWEGPTTLYEMLKLPKELAGFVNNYKLNIYDYHDHSDFSAFKTELRVVFEALKTSGDERKMKDIFQHFPKIESDTARLIEALLNIKFDKKHLVKDEKGKVWLEVCKAWDDHFKSGKMEGIVIGREEVLMTIICKKIRKNLSLDMIADDLEDDIEVIRPIYEAAKKQVANENGL